ncbi:hypothetical protein E2C01_034069 [Portunus trituberculatus]|uniref:Uncharacterized protein n=1 Tax=Portunus trituberculatus TaxID=210409 RepID=A0A5B7F5F8_PORTR|nr:hypothetical protein [Portunus trituberculatus]
MQQHKPSLPPTTTVPSTLTTHTVYLLFYLSISTLRCNAGGTRGLQGAGSTERWHLKHLVTAAGTTSQNCVCVFYFHYAIASHTHPPSTCSLDPNGEGHLPPTI